MPRTNYKNVWGTATQRGQRGIDQQRNDLFMVRINLPLAIGGSGAWQEHVEFAVDKFPFSDRSREMIPVKYMNQTNHLIGADSPSSAVEIAVRYAFSEPTAKLLEKWHFLTSNPVTGAVALTSAVKADGTFEWLKPDMAALESYVRGTGGGTGTPMVTAQKYYLEGCLIKGLKFAADADMTQGNAVVSLSFSLQVDRWYMEDLNYAST